MTFNPNIPSGGQTISSTTVPIQTNFNVANTAFGIDHVPFITATNQGRHNKATLIQQPSDPAAVSLCDILYTKSVSYGAPYSDTKNELFLRRASGDGSTIIQMSTRDPIASTNGASFLPGGVIIQWGQTSFVGSSNPAITFPEAFPNNPFSVQITIQNSNPAVPNAWRITSLSASGFVANVQVTGATTMYWMAIGN